MSFAEKCRGRGQELLALSPAVSGPSTALERVGGLCAGGEGAYLAPFHVRVI